MPDFHRFRKGQRPRGRLRMRMPRIRIKPRFRAPRLGRNRLSTYTYKLIFSEFIAQDNVGGKPITGQILLNFPGYVCPSGSAVPRLMTLQPSNYTRLFNLFDEYHVNMMSAKFVCPTTTNDLGNAGLMDPTAVTSFWPTIHSGIDLDDYAVITGTARAQCLLKYKARKLIRSTGSVSENMKQYTSIDRRMFANTAAYDPNNMPNQAANITYANPKRGSIKYFIQNWHQNNFCMELVTTWYITFRGLRTDVAPEASIVDFETEFPITTTPAPLDIVQPPLVKIDPISDDVYKERIRKLFS